VGQPFELQEQRLSSLRSGVHLGASMPTWLRRPLGLRTRPLAGAVVVCARLRPHTVAMKRVLAVLLAIGAVRLGAPQWYGANANAFFDGQPAAVRGLCASLVEFERADTETRAKHPESRYAGEWALVTHQMSALGLGQVLLANPEWRSDYGPWLRLAALKSFLPEMRDFGTRAWHGEDALQSLEGMHGHAYLGYSGLSLRESPKIGGPSFTPSRSPRTLSIASLHTGRPALRIQSNACDEDWPFRRPIG
jgi:hypothetical protein